MLGFLSLLSNHSKPILIGLAIISVCGFFFYQGIRWQQGRDAEAQNEVLVASIENQSRILRAMNDQAAAFESRRAASERKQQADLKRWKDAVAANTAYYGCIGTDDGLRALNEALRRPTGPAGQPDSQTR